MSVYIEDQKIHNIYYSPTTDSQDIVPVLNGYLAEPYSETCLYFDGVNDYLQATENSKLNFTSPIIVEFKYESETYSPYLISKTSTYINANNEWGIVGNQYVLTFRAGSVTYDSLRFTANLNQRYRIRIQVEGSDLVYYVDGVELGRHVSPNLPSTNSNPFRVGYSFVPNPLHGRLYYLQVGSEIFNIDEGSGSTTTGTEGTVLNINGATWVTETGVVKNFYRDGA